MLCQINAENPCRNLDCAMQNYLSYFSDPSRWCFARIASKLISDEELYCTLPGAQIPMILTLFTVRKAKNRGRFLNIMEMYTRNSGIYLRVSMTIVPILGIEAMIMGMATKIPDTAFGSPLVMKVRKSPLERKPRNVEAP